VYLPCVLYVRLLAAENCDNFPFMDVIIAADVFVYSFDASRVIGKRSYSKKRLSVNLN
jgi:hypothetical protein